MIYLDHNATTPPAPGVVEAMQPWLGREFGNPSSAHTAGQRAREAVEHAREQVAKAVGAGPGEVVLTSGGTEADLLALVGAALSALSEERGGGRVARGLSGRVVISAIEHEAVLHAAAILERLGCEVVRVRPASSGRIEPEVFIDACTPDTLVASLMLASNEIGVVEPVAEVARHLREHKIVFHTDAVQAVGKRPVDLTTLGVDLLSLSGHKFGGPKGAGALVGRRAATLVPLQGGSQEGGRRGGTHNVAAIVGLGAAAAALPARLERMPAVERLRDRLEGALGERLEQLRIHGATTERVANTTSVAFRGVDAASLVVGLDMAGVCVSRGSACMSGAEEPSHVLAALGIEGEWARGTVRLSLGVETTSEEIDEVVEVIIEAVQRQRVGRSVGSSAS